MDVMTAPVPSLRTGSEFIALAELSAGLPLGGGDGLAVLLAAARPFDDGFAPLRPLWAHEATARALGLLELFTALRRREPRAACSADRHRLALHLASIIGSLETKDLYRALPCSGALREVARDLVALFEPAIGCVTLGSDVAALSLAAYKRRALVLLAHELVVNALLHAFAGRDGGHVSLRLEHLDGGRVRMTVADDGIGFVCGRPRPATSVAGSLADLLEGELRYRNPAGRGTQASVVFPLL